MKHTLGWDSTGRTSIHQAQSLSAGHVCLLVVHLELDADWQPSNLLDSGSRFRMHDKGIPVGVSCRLYHRLRFSLDSLVRNVQATEQKSIASSLYGWCKMNAYLATYFTDISFWRL